MINLKIYICQVNSHRTLDCLRPDGVHRREIQALEVQKTRFRRKWDPQKLIWSKRPLMEARPTSLRRSQKIMQLSCFMSKHQRSYEEVMGTERWKNENKFKQTAHHVALWIFDTSKGRPMGVWHVAILCGARTSKKSRKGQWIGPYYKFTPM